MTSKDKDRIIHIVVCGVSGPESLRGALGVGKSSLCNRFIRPLADDYQPDDHISTISQSDFSGRVINNDHFLYWGNVTKRNEDGAEVHFSVIEQTEFVDDQSFAPLRGSNTQPYHKRCAVTKLTSAEKLMYICKYQLGEEDGYEKVVLPEPKFVVDGYLLVFDVSSKVRGRPIQKQLEFLGILHQQIAKQKRPILVVATKCDEVDEHYLKEARNFAAKIKTTLVETSSNEAVNVDLSFMTLAQLVDRTKGKPREVPFSEAIKLRTDLLNNITDAYMQLLKNDVTDYHTLWKAKQKEYQKTRRPYLSYVQHLGTQNARKMFDRHKKKLKEEHLRKKQLQYLTTLPKALEDILPDLKTIDDRTWEQCKVNLNEHPQFAQWFIMLDEEWKYSPYIDSNETQIPYDFLTTNNEECKKVFNIHVDRLQAIKRKNRMKADYKKKLVALKDVIIPGRKIEDTYTHLANEESFRELSDDERKVIYDRYQEELKKAATDDFLEMLYEKYDLFERFETMEAGDNYVEEAREVEEALQNEKRYKALSELKNERKVMLYKHIAFMHNPTKETCPSRDKCMDKLIQECIECRVPRSPVKESVNRWSETNGKLNVVLLGYDGLADELANEIRQQSCDDDYTLDGALHSLDLRPIDGDVSQPRNYLATDKFSPQGCICTFTSVQSFQYVKSCLEKTLLATNNDERYASLRSLPVVLLFARDVSVPDSDIRHLREDAEKLSERLNHCFTIKMPTDESIIWQGKKFHESQIQKSLRYIVDIKKNSEFNSDDGLDVDEPDLRIGMALMCGDKYFPDLVLGPLVSHDTCYQTPDLEQSITVDLFLGTERKKIDVDVMSYHQNTLYRDDIHHGYILVYSTKRTASFETMKVFLEGLEQTHMPVPTLIVGVQDMDKSSSSYETQVLRLEGHKLAEQKAHCKFLPAGAAFQGQPLAYSVFLKEAYEKRMETEQLYDYVQDSCLDSSFQARTPSMSDEDSLYALPSSYGRTPDRQRLPGSPYAYGHGKSSSLPSRRHSDLGEHPLEDLYAKVDKTHKRTGSAEPPPTTVEDPEGWVDCSVYDQTTPAMNQRDQHRRSLPPDDPNALYAAVSRAPGDGHEDGMLRNPIYEPVEQQQVPKKKPPPPPVKPKPSMKQDDKPKQDEKPKQDDKPPLPARPDNLPTRIHELQGDLDAQNRIRHTSSDSDSTRSMDAINRVGEPMSKRKRSYRRKKEPRTRGDLQLDYIPIPSSPVMVDPNESLNEPDIKRQTREEKERAEKEKKRQKKLDKKKERERKKVDKRNRRKPQTPAPPQKPRGPPIETLVGPGEVIPPFVILCLNYIEQEGLTTEGVYRVPGKGVDSDALISKFEEEKNVNISDMEISVHAVATAIKQFFSQLPEPLVPRITQEEFLDQFKVVGGENFRSALPELMNKLPEVNRNVFAFMMLHLNRIMQNSAINKMTAENLSTCWWPTLLQPMYKSLEDMANHAPLQNVVITCIQDAPELFPELILTPGAMTQDPDYDTVQGTEESSEFQAESDTSMTTPVED